MKTTLILILTIFLFNGCMNEQLEPKIKFDTKPVVQKPNAMQVKTIQRKNGSLFSPTGNSYFTDKKNLLPGDIIQVTITESLTANSSGERKTDKANSTDLGGGVTAPATGVTPFTGVTSLTNKVNNAIGIGFTTESTNSFTGKSSAKHAESFQTTISCVIQQKYQNGNYLVYGQKEILVDGQLQLIRVSGVIRPFDIMPDNTIESSKLANAQIMYKKQGVEHDATIKPWGTTVIENVWPF